MAGRNAVHLYPHLIHELAFGYTFLGVYEEQGKEWNHPKFI
jgi:hypothetical protein